MPKPHSGDQYNRVIFGTSLGVCVCVIGGGGILYIEWKLKIEIQYLC